MSKKEITKEDIEQIQNASLGSSFWEMQLGIGLKYEYVEGNIKFSAPYPEIGRKFWKAFKFELHEFLCDRKTKEPQEWLKDLITGDIRNLVVSICSLITSKYDVSLGIALPVAALIIKNGTLNYCSNSPKKSKKTVLQILKNFKI